MASPAEVQYLPTKDVVTLGREERLNAARKKLRSFRARQGRAAESSSSSTTSSSAVASGSGEQQLANSGAWDPRRDSGLSNASSSFMDQHRQHRKTISITKAAMMTALPPSPVNSLNKGHGRRISKSRLSSQGGSMSSSGHGHTRSRASFSLSTPEKRSSSSLSSSSSPVKDFTVPPPTSEVPFVSLQKQFPPQSSESSNTFLPFTAISMPMTMPIMSTKSESYPTAAEVLAARRGSAASPNPAAAAAATPAIPSVTPSSPFSGSPLPPGHGRRASRHNRQGSISNFRESLEIVSGTGIYTGSTLTPAVGSFSTPLFSSSPTFSISHNDPLLSFSTSSPRTVSPSHSPILQNAWTSTDPAKVLEALKERGRQQDATDPHQDPVKTRLDALQALEGRLSAPSEMIDLGNEAEGELFVVPRSPGCIAGSTMSMLPPASPSVGSNNIVNGNNNSNTYISSPLIGVGSVSNVNSNNNNNNAGRRNSWNALGAVTAAGAQGALNLGMLIEEEEGEYDEDEDEELGSLPGSVQGSPMRKLRGSPRRKRSSTASSRASSLGTNTSSANTTPTAAASMMAKLQQSPSKRESDGDSISSSTAAAEQPPSFMVIPIRPDSPSPESSVAVTPSPTPSSPSSSPMMIRAPQLRSFSLGSTAAAATAVATGGDPTMLMMKAPSNSNTPALGETDSSTRVSSSPPDVRRSPNLEQRRLSHFHAVAVSAAEGHEPIIAAHTTTALVASGSSSTSSPAQQQQQQHVTSQPGPRGGLRSLSMGNGHTAIANTIPPGSNANANVTPINSRRTVSSSIPLSTNGTPTSFIGGGRPTPPSGGAGGPGSGSVGGSGGPGIAPPLKRSSISYRKSGTPEGFSSLSSMDGFSTGSIASASGRRPSWRDSSPGGQLQQPQQQNSPHHHPSSISPSRSAVPARASPSLSQGTAHQGGSAASNRSLSAFPFISSSSSMSSSHGSFTGFGEDNEMSSPAAAAAAGGVHKDEITEQKRERDGEETDDVQRLRYIKEAFSLPTPSDDLNQMSVQVQAVQRQMNQLQLEHRQVLAQNQATHALQMTEFEKKAGEEALCMKARISELESEVDTEKTARRFEVEGLTRELEQEREVMQDVTGERDALREDVQGWRTRCNALEAMAKKEREDDALAVAQAKLIGEMRDQIYNLVAALEKERVELDEARNEIERLVAERSAYPGSKAGVVDEDDDNVDEEIQSSLDGRDSYRHGIKTASDGSLLSTSSFGRSFSGNTTEDTSINTEFDEYSTKMSSPPSRHSSFGQAVGYPSTGSKGGHTSDFGGSVVALGGLDTLAEEEEEETEEIMSPPRQQQQQVQKQQQQQQQPHQQPHQMLEDGQHTGSMSTSSTSNSEVMPMTPSKEQPLSHHQRSDSFVRHWSFPKGSVSSVRVSSDDDHRFFDLDRHISLPPLPMSDTILPPFLTAGLEVDENQFNPFEAQMGNSSSIAHTRRPSSPRPLDRMTPHTRRFSGQYASRAPPVAPSALAHAALVATNLNAAKSGGIAAVKGVVDQQPSPSRLSRLTFGALFGTLGGWAPGARAATAVTNAGALSQLSATMSTTREEEVRDVQEEEEGEVDDRFFTTPSPVATTAKVVRKPLPPVVSQESKRKYYVKPDQQPIPRSSPLRILDFTPICCAEEPVLFV